jgi:hypothetical protein
MRDDEIADFLDKPVRVTLADGRILAGTIHAQGDAGHGHVHYMIVSAPIEEGQKPVAEMVHGADQITNVEDASNDPAASE